MKRPSNGRVRGGTIGKAISVVLLIVVAAFVVFAACGGLHP